MLNLKVTQSDVDEKFQHARAHLPGIGGWQHVCLGRARLTGNTSFDQKIPLKGLKTKPRRAVLNYYDDVLASPN